MLESRNLLSNVPVNNPAEDVVLPNGTGRFTQSETSTAVANDGTVVVAFNDTEETFGNIFTRDEHVTGYAYSTDGGKTFTDAGGLPESDAGDGGDPILAVNRSNGHVYFTTVGSFFSRRASSSSSPPPTTAARSARRSMPSPTRLTVTYWTSRG
jgi:hypothetical protein